MNKEQKIFCIGLPRTGTTSLDLAFKELGIPAIHFPFEFWERRDFSALEEYQAFTDTPIFAMYEELDQRHPNSKFILTTRPLDEWLRSMKWLRKNSGKLWQRRPEFDQFNLEYFGSPDFDPSLYEDAYYNHLNGVKTYFTGREDQLLVLELAQEQDCRRMLDFLGMRDCPVFTWPKANPAREPSFLQSVAYHFERRNYFRVGSYIRRAEDKIRQQFA